MMQGKLQNVMSVIQNKAKAKDQFFDIVDQVEKRTFFNQPRTVLAAALPRLRVLSCLAFNPAPAYIRRSSFRQKRGRQWGPGLSFGSECRLWDTGRREPSSMWEPAPKRAPVSGTLIAYTALLLVILDQVRALVGGAGP